MKAFAQRRKAQDIYGFNSDQFFEIVIVKQKTAEGMTEFVAARVKLEVVEVRVFLYMYALTDYRLTNLEGN